MIRDDLSLDDDRPGVPLFGFYRQRSTMKPPQRGSITDSLFFRPFAQFHASHLITNRRICHQNSELLSPPVASNDCSTWTPKFARQYKGSGLRKGHLIRVKPLEVRGQRERTVVASA